MSRSRKHITSQIINSYPEPQPNESIVRVISTRGTNQVEVEYPNKEKILVMMPSKFKKLVWTKKGDYLIIATDRSEVNKGKIKGIIEHILVTHQIKHLKKMGIWPVEFVEKTPSVATTTTIATTTSTTILDQNQDDENTNNNNNNNKNHTSDGGENGQVNDGEEQVTNDGEPQEEREENGSDYDDDDESDDDAIFDNPNRMAYSESESDDDDSDDSDDE